MPQKFLGRCMRVAALLMMGLASSSPAQAQNANPATQAQKASVTGRNATSVTVGQAGKRMGEIRNDDGNRWVEIDASGQGVNEFVEVRRDDSSVYLLDRGRGMTLQLDLRARKVSFSDARTRRREMYTILSAKADPVAGKDALNPLELDRSAGPLSSRRRLGNMAPADSGPEFCMSDSVTRGAGKIPGRVAECPAGYAINGGVCKRAAHTIPAPSRAAECPAGYNSKGSSCERAASTKANPGSRLADCPDGFTNTGEACFRLSAPNPLPVSSMTCRSGESKTDSRCFKTCEAGYTNAGANCVRPASMLGAESLTCKAGFQKSGKGQRCVAECEAGYTNNGEACVRPADTLGMDAMSCKAGETLTGGRCYPANGACAIGEVQQGGLCYTACASGFDGVGTLCLAQPPKSWLQCGIGAAKDAQACAAPALDQFGSVKHMAVLVGTLGSSGAGQAAMQKKFKDMNEAYSKLKDLPQFKKARGAWEQANPVKDSQGAYRSLDGMAAAVKEEDMTRYAAQLAAIAELAGGGAAPASGYPKCSILFPAK